MNLEDWILKYEEYLLMVRNRSVNTVRGYTADLRLLYKATMAGHADDWSAFTRQMAIDYVKSLKRQQRDTSVARKVYCFKGFFKFLRREGNAVSNPFEDMEFNRLNRSLPKFFTVDEMNKLLNRIREPLPAFKGIPLQEVYLTVRDRAMLEILYSAALRVSELVGLNWQDVNWSGREVHVLGKGNKERLCTAGAPPT